MTIEQIVKFLTNHPDDINKPVKISFKTRNTLEGLFIRAVDFDELKSKNFWRIVTPSNMENYKKTKDSRLAKLFHGVEFTKLSSK
jgi:hypothetical protein